MFFSKSYENNDNDFESAQSALSDDIEEVPELEDEGPPPLEEIPLEEENAPAPEANHPEASENAPEPNQDYSHYYG